MKNGRKTMNCFYRKLFDEPYMYLPEEIDDEDEGEIKRGTRRYSLLYSMGWDIVQKKIGRKESYLLRYR
jgi:hypothetical protein